MEQISLFELDKLVEEINNPITTPIKPEQSISVPAPKPVKKEETDLLETFVIIHLPNTIVWM